MIITIKTEILQQTSDLLRYLDKRIYREEPKIVKNW